MGVQTFTAAGPPSPVHLEYVRTISGSGGGFAQAYLVATTEYRATQPPNSIDLLGSRVTYSSWDNGTLMTLDQRAAFDVVSADGDLYELSATVIVPLLDSNSTWGPGFVLEAQAQVETYVHDYFSPTVTVNGTVQEPSPHPRWSGFADGVFYFDAYAPLPATAASWFVAFGFVRREPRLHGCAAVLMSSVLGGYLASTAPAWWPR